MYRGRYSHRCLGHLRWKASACSNDAFLDSKNNQWNLIHPNLCISLCGEVDLFDTRSRLCRSVFYRAFNPSPCFHPLKRRGATLDRRNVFLIAPWRSWITCTKFNVFLSVTFACFPLLVNCFMTTLLNPPPLPGDLRYDLCSGFDKISLNWIDTKTESNVCRAVTLLKTNTTGIRRRFSFSDSFRFTWSYCVISRLDVCVYGKIFRPVLDVS